MSSNTGDTTVLSAPKVGLLSVYFSLFDEQMPPDFRRRLEAVAETYRSLLAADFDVVYPGLISSDESGRLANEAFRQAGVGAVVFAPTMAAPPSYAAQALEGLQVPVVIWNAPLVDRLGSDLDQAAAHEHTSVISAVMVGNALFRAGRPAVAVTASPSDVAGVQRLIAKVRASMAESTLRNAVLLRVGDPIEGYVDVETTDNQLAAIGLVERCVEEVELVAALRDVADDDLESLRADILTRGWTGEPDERSLRVAAALLALAARYEVVGGTVNCHGPLFRFSEEVGVCACLGVSLLTASGRPFSCTGDQPTAIALMLGRTIAGAALYSEIFAPELATGLALVGNGGEGDPAWAAGEIQLAPSQHYPGIHGRGTSLSFALECGPCTLLSLSPGPSGWRAAWARAEVVESRYPRMAAPNGMIRFVREPDSGRAVDRWATSGATHHQALLRGEMSEALLDALAAANIEAIEAI